MPPSPPETRASLILRLRNPADVAAWDEVVSVYGPLVFRMARRRGLQPADADDLVQEVFSAVARQVGDWVLRPDRGRFRAWLLQIARNIAVNLLTRKPFGAIGVGGDEAEGWLEEIPEQVDELSSQFDVEYRREVFRWAAEQVRESVARTTWQAFQLTHVEDVSIADAALQLGISVGNVYIARSRVMKRLRELAEKFEVRE
jgi:RNA polymerase sigma-70 factor (ECF subfamily)